jgi:formylglycine-generating enzyme required for sulfatase activity
MRFAIALALALVAGCDKPPARFVEPRTQLRFVFIPAGEFTMGDGADRHRVRIAQPFYMSESEVTQQQWMAVMGSNPSWFVIAGPDAPVERVSWYEARDFVRRLSASGTGRYRLPTEAEWEYACRAGTTTAYAFGDRITKRDANFDGHATMPVESFRPNRWGLYDMHGNVWEWCADDDCPYGKRCTSPYKIIRGGSWYFGADSARSALRYRHEPNLRGVSIGFRVVREVD